MSNIVLEAKNISKSFTDGKTTVEVIKNLSLQVKAGEFVSIVGSSGSGKSTLLHVLGGLDGPTEGQVFLNEQRFDILGEAERGYLRNQHLGFVYQFHHLLPEFTALENVCIPAYIKKTDRNIAETRAMELLDHLNLSHRLHHKPKELSGGEQQRVAFARALINQPKLILADEPTGNLDEKSANELHDLILKFRTEYELTFILVTHSPLLAARCDRVIEMSEGSIVMQ